MPALQARMFLAVCKTLATKPSDKVTPPIVQNFTPNIVQIDSHAMIALASFQRSNSAENGEGFRRQGVVRKPRTAKSYQSGSRNSRPPDAFAFWRWYSA
jgi:hypothetical protein